MVEELKNKLITLQDKKESIESELLNNYKLLNLMHVSTTDSLVDADDFPRADIPVYEARTARSKIIHLKTDLKNVVQDIEKTLEEYHKLDKKDPVIFSEELKVDQFNYRTFAKVSNIAKGSPSDKAGLRDGDLISEFGSINGNNFKSIADIASAASSSLDMYMKVVVEREGKRVRVNLRPKAWEGKGYLGCFISELNSC